MICILLMLYRVSSNSGWIGHWQYGRPAAPVLYLHGRKHPLSGLIIGLSRLVTSAPAFIRVPDARTLASTYAMKLPVNEIFGGEMASLRPLDEA